MKKQSALYDWDIEVRDGWSRLRGKVFGDSRWPDGTTVTTSSLLNIDFVAKVAETQNTVYSLQ
jgi:hypothetical protein